MTDVIDHGRRLMGVAEVADFVGIPANTVSVWLSRGKMPEPDHVINNGRTKVWYRRTITDWEEARNG